ncbi:hypothetical protein ONZ51_g2083 [Trametes cubensis]|uniref:Uncharacterized protein n=1 Tax=Trametes cubensis TaxID=1111947 RepID=A0AAD7U087_9APHY|nr:hypothetical protein ONZ51_g2083 [Trametes cubensis]
MGPLPEPPLPLPTNGFAAGVIQTHQFHHRTFTLDASGFAGFFGGDGAAESVATVHLVKWRRWLGWYNAPGLFEIVRHYGGLVVSEGISALFPVTRSCKSRDPATIFELEGQHGPRFIASYAGSEFLGSGHPAHLLARTVRHSNLVSKPTVIPNARRKTSQYNVTTMALSLELPEPEMCPPMLKDKQVFFAILPIIGSLVATIYCAYIADWYCCASIALGAIANGFACLQLGCGRLTFRHPAPRDGAPPGDGIFILEGHAGVVVVHGSEGAVSSLTLGRFHLEFSDNPIIRCLLTGLCMAILVAQCMVQLLLIPQGTLYGQGAFVASLALSWLYNHLLALDKEDMQTGILLGEVLHLQERDVQRFSFGTRTAMAVFTVLSLWPPSPDKLLDALLPNNTPVWQRWREVLVGQLLAVPFQGLRFDKDHWEVPGFDGSSRKLLRDLFVDAEEAYNAWCKYGRKPA